MNNFTKKWLVTGLIDKDLPELDQIILANNLEEAAQELLSRVGDLENILERKAGLFIPIVVRLFHEKKLRVVDDMTALYNNFEKFYNQKYDAYVGGYCAMDNEAEFCCDYVEQFDKL
jgi:hypothetical protein